MKKTKGVLPFAGRVPAEAEHVLLQLVAEDLLLAKVIKPWDYQVVRMIARKFTSENVAMNHGNYADLDDCWGAVRINSDNSRPLGESRAVYLLSNMLKKLTFNDKETAKLRRKAAIDKMLLAEKLCYTYNRGGYRSLTWSDDPKVNVWYGKMQKFILKLIGETPLLSEIMKYSRHGTGASTTHKSLYGHRYYKYAKVPYACSPNAVSLSHSFINNDERWLRALTEHGIDKENWIEVRNHNRIEFVPKSAKEDRPIACENAMDLFIQLGVDGYIRKRLKTVGVDINDQSINQRLAREGSITGGLATLDLSMASDTVSLALVEKLLPRDWVLFLHKIRAEAGTYIDIDGNEQVITYNKISSMGNGFTFALETLIFTAAIAAMGSDIEFGNNACVYGDDLIVPTKYSTDVVKLLNLCGFTVNTSKSFFEGPIRESCGSDWYLGVGIRPFFVREPLNDMDAFGAFSLINSLTEWFEYYGIMPDTLKSRKQLLTWLHPKLHLYGPYAKEISAYICSPTVGKRRKNGHYTFPVALAKPRKFHGEEESLDFFRMLANDLTSYDAANPYEYKFQKQFSNLGHELSFLKEASATLGLRGLADPYRNLVREASSKFDVTRRGQYSVEIREHAGRCFDWPTMFAALDN